jgi:hypothetical protein
MIASLLLNLRSASAAKFVTDDATILETRGAKGFGSRRRAVHLLRLCLLKRYTSL